MTIALRGYELAVTAMAHIELDPASWDQAVWGKAATTDTGRLTSDGDSPPVDPLLAVDACGSSFCFFGWSVLLAGKKLNWSRRNVFDEKVTWMADCAGDDETSIGFVARELLELDDRNIYEPQRLSESTNTLPQLYRLLAEMYGVKKGDLRRAVMRRMEEIVQARLAELNKKLRADGKPTFEGSEASRIAREAQLEASGER